MTMVLLLLLKVSIAALIFSIGMGSTFSDVSWLWRRPGLLLRSLLGMYVLVPVVAFVLVWLLPLEPTVKAALLILAVSAGAPLLPKKLGPVHSDQYVFSLVVTSSLLAIIWVPVWIHWLARHFGVPLDVPASAIAITIAHSFLLPLVAGMLVRAIWPTLAIALSDKLIALGGLVLMLDGVLLLILHWRVLQQVGAAGFGALLLMLLLALLIGHLLGGPGAGERTSLAVACATRHIGVAILVATSFPGTQTTVLVAAYVVASSLVSVPYLQLRKKAAVAEAPPG
ncbi:hypothetical protein ABB29_01970 [Pseudoxanthomonas dokdonensis]|uniref:Na+-dependent transporter n=2 Tax=Pseudoxanthomonas dokdonensis TaxID=344882 RepID=A0A0R0CZK0_9GAMM|nr:hypothetical protein ABB29_01970 [Pseudoxanthomonas dokdonensis]